VVRSGLNARFETAHAILILSGRYLLQLRDDKPSISAPGQWSLFGGRIDGGENPAQAIEREIFEELTIRPKGFVALWPMDYYDELEKRDARAWLFSADVTDVWGGQVLKEGQDAMSFSYQELGGLDIPQIMRDALDRFHSEKEQGVNAVS